MDGGNDSELWRTNGTEAGTKLVKDTGAGGARARAQQHRGALYFGARSDVFGKEPWILRDAGSPGAGPDRRR